MAIPKKGRVIAIDGPAGTGKSSATKRLAEKMGFIHVDTGALYRSVALMAVERDLIGHSGALTPEIAEAVVELARRAHFEFKRELEHNPSNRIYVNGTDVTEQIRTAEVSMLASVVSAIPGVRAALLGLQRRLGCSASSILEGRDIGTVVFPDADLKFFLTASVEERAKRRLAEIEARGEDVPSFEEVKRQIAERDAGDMGRAVAPLRKAPDAVEVDTTEMTLDEVVLTLEKHAKKLRDLHR